MEYQQRMNIKSWALEDRPREKFATKGASALSEAELIAILLRSGTREKTAVEVARQLLAAVDNDLRKLSRMSLKELEAFPGIGLAKAVTVKAALELGHRRERAEVQDSPKITSSQDVYERMKPLLADKTREEFWVMTLNRANRPIREYCLSQGGLAGTVADPRIIFKHAIEDQASSIILCHNHPSGNRNPSAADADLTRRIAQSGELMDIKLLDHLIITDSGYYSFADEGRL